jgi:hypothetical protein
VNLTGRLSYLAYDLACRSELPLPELQRASAPPHVEIAVAAIDRPSGATNAQGTSVEVTRDAAWLFHAGVGTFHVAHGRGITVDPAAGVAPALLRTFVLGPAFGTLLRQRGRLTLHGSAVAMDDRAVLFLGASGAGKSTTAAAFHARGCPLIADDIVAIDAAGAEPLTFPGFPRLKLGRTAATLAGIRQPPEEIVDGKGSFAADRGFASMPLPLSRVFVLTNAEQPEVRRLSPPEALVELLRHSYGARTLQAVNRDRHFAQCAAVARRVPVLLLSRGSARSDCTQFFDTIEKYVV